MREIQISLSSPSSVVEPPSKIKVEYAERVSGNLEQLKRDIEEALSGQASIFSTDVELVEAGTFPRFEMKAYCVRKLYE